MFSVMLVFTLGKNLHPGTFQFGHQLIILARSLNLRANNSE